MYIFARDTLFTMFTKAVGAIRIMRSTLQCTKTDRQSGRCYRFTVYWTLLGITLVTFLISQLNLSVGWYGQLLFFVSRYSLFITVFSFSFGPFGVPCTRLRGMNNKFQKKRSPRWTNASKARRQEIRNTSRWNVFNVVSYFVWRCSRYGVHVTKKKKREKEKKGRRSGKLGNENGKKYAEEFIFRKLLR